MTFDSQKCELKGSQSELHSIGYRNRTDKTWIQPDGLSYLVYYERYMRERRLHIRLLEIGVRDGASLKTWNEYFSDSSFVGIDIDPSCNRLTEYQNIEVIVQDAKNPQLVEALRSGAQFDYIIDDGSHLYSDIVRCLELYFPLLKPDGTFIIEDLGTVDRMAPGTISNLLGLIYGRLRNIRVDMYHDTLILSRLLPHESAAATSSN